MRLFIEAPQAAVPPCERADGPAPVTYGGAAAVERADRSYSVAQESYQEELEYERARRKRRRSHHIVRAVLLALLIPVFFAALFLAAYVAACIVNGASPGELVQLLGALGTRLAGLVGIG